jgi:hypothetical protein
MSRSRVKWKKVSALSTAVAAALLPAFANATTPSLEVSLSLSPLGTTAQTSEYVAPDATIPVYVYATVTGSGAVNSTGNLDGLQYLYYDVNATVTSGTTGGIFTSATLAPGFTGGAQNGSGGTNGAQTGLIGSSAYTGTSSIALGSTGTTTTLMANIAKPRAVSAVWSNASSGVVINGNSVSFLVETLTYTPSFTATAAGSTLNSTQFSVSIPSLAGVDYAPDNYFVGSGTTTSSTNTFSSNYFASANPVTVTEAEQGDVNLDGVVNGTDAGIIAGSFNTGPGVVGGWKVGDLNDDGYINGTDAGVVAANFNVQYGLPDSFATAPNGVTSGGAVSTALIGGGAASVPEPATLGLLVFGGLSFLGLRRSRI